MNTYYGLLQDGGACVSNFGVTPDEVSFINQEQTQLNAAITTAAKAQNATVVPIDFTGHQLCTASSWVQGVNDLAPLHPTATGQKYIAQQDVAALDRIAK